MRRSRRCGRWSLPRRSRCDGDSRWKRWPHPHSCGPRPRRGCEMPRLKVTQVRSGIGGTAEQRDTLRSLGLKRLRDTVVKEDRPEIRGMIRAVAHLVRVEEVE